MRNTSYGPAMSLPPSLNPTFRAELALAEGRDKGLDSLEGARVLHTSTEVAVPEGGEGRGVLGALLLPPALNAVQVKREGD